MKNDIAQMFFEIPTLEYKNKIYLTSSYSETQIEEMRSSKIKLIKHVNRLRQNYLDFIFKEDPNYPKQVLKIPDQSDYSRHIDLWIKNSYHFSDVTNNCRIIDEQAIPGRDMREYDYDLEHKLRTLGPEDDAIRKHFHDESVLIDAPEIQGNSSSVSKTPLTALVFLINDCYGIFTHIWECRIYIPYEEWDGTGEENTRRTGFQLTQEHFTNEEKYKCQIIIGDKQLNVPRKDGRGYLKYPGLILAPIV